MYDYYHTENYVALVIVVSSDATVIDSTKMINIDDGCICPWQIQPSLSDISLSTMLMTAVLCTMCTTASDVALIIVVSYDTTMINS